MASSARDRISVDLHGLGAELVAYARQRRVGVSEIVRDSVAITLRSDGVRSSQRSSRIGPAPCAHPPLARLSLRLTAEEITRLDAGARAAGLPRSAFVAGLVDGIAVLAKGGRSDHRSALIRSCAELSTLGRNLRHLADLLRGSDFAAAQEYRAMLDSIADDVARHLKMAGSVLADMTSARHGGRHGRRFGKPDEERSNG